MQIFGAGADVLMRMMLCGLAALPVLATGLAYGLTRSPYTTGLNMVMRQPIPFSHEHHVGRLGLDCRYCHTSVERSAFAGLPPTGACMTCHSQLFTNAKMLAPARESLASGKPIHWNRVNNLPDYVYFDHSVHVQNGVGCSTCHGAIETMPLTRQAAPLTMGWCLNCHRNPAPYLRPPDEIFDQAWAAPDDQAKQGRALMAHYGIKLDHLTDCSRCHR
jgi:hypothetical protein